MVERFERLPCWSWSQVDLGGHSSQEGQSSEFHTLGIKLSPRNAIPLFLSYETKKFMYTKARTSQKFTATQGRPSSSPCFEKRMIQLRVYARGNTELRLLTLCS